MTIRIECVTTPQRLAQLALPWQTLWQRSGSDIFQHHGWLNAWATATANRGDTRLRIMLAWLGEHLIAVLPCTIRRMRGLRTLQWAAQDFSDYCDAVVDPDADWPAALEALWADLERRGGVDVVQLRQVRPDARVRRLFLREGRALRIEENHERCLRIDCIWPSGDAYFRSLTKKGRNNHTRGKRILEELGGAVTFRCLDRQQDITPALDRLLELKRIWLEATDPGSVLLTRDAELLRAMLECAVKIGFGSLFVIECGGRIVAASLNFLYDSKMQAYFTAYDQAFERASPGTILIVEYSKWAFDRGLRQVDFLRGDETFKFRLGNAETLLDGFLDARSLIGHAALIVRGWQSRLRRSGSADASAAEPDMPGAEASLDRH